LAPPAGRAAFASRDFRYALAASWIGTMAIQVLGVAVGWWVYDLTRRPFSLGLVGLSIFLPSVALTLWAGHAADRYDRRKILMACYALCAAATVGIAALALVGSRDVRPI
jgi:MFS family permease